MLCIDLFCGLGGWAEGFLAAGYEVIGFDIERRSYPGHLVLQDVGTLEGSQFRNATCIVASPPCQAYSYRAMPFQRARSSPKPDTTLFESCFRIQREAMEHSERYIPLIVENVWGAQRWVGPAKSHYGSFYLWGDVPALLPYHGGIGDGIKGFAEQFHNTLVARFWSDSEKRRQAIAQISKVPFVLAKFIADVFQPVALESPAGFPVPEKRRAFD